MTISTFLFFVLFYFSESPYIHHVILYNALLLIVIFLSGIIIYQCRTKKNQNQVDINVERRSNTDSNNVNDERRTDSGLRDRNGYIFVQARRIPISI